MGRTGRSGKLGWPQAIANTQETGYTYVFDRTVNFESRGDVDCEPGCSRRTRSFADTSIAF